MITDDTLRIFYSWQSWSSSSTNRSFIEECLEGAIKQLPDNLIQAIVIDRDTKNLPGSPSIADAILEKIDRCYIFLADATIVVKDKDNENRKSPNPNVLLELGYAVKALGWDRIILVMNQAYGDPKDLPFDFQHRRWPLQYRLEDKQPKTDAREKLTKQLIFALETMLKSDISFSESIVEKVERLVNDETKTPELDRTLRNEIEKVYEATSSADFFSERTKFIEQFSRWSRESWEQVYEFYFPKCQSALTALISLSSFGKPQQTKYITRAIKRWLEIRDLDHFPHSAWQYLPGLFVIYASGIAAILNEKWDYLAIAFARNPIRNPSNDRQEPTLDVIIDFVILPYWQDQLRDNPADVFPIGKKFQELLRPLFRRYSSEEYLEAFDICEFLLSLTYLYDRLSLNLQKRILPRIGYTENKRADVSIFHFLEQGGKKGSDWGLLKSGLFESRPQIFLDTLSEYQDRLTTSDGYRTFAYGVSDYVGAYQRGLSLSGG